MEIIAAIVFACLVATAAILLGVARSARRRRRRAWKAYYDDPRAGDRTSRRGRR